MGNPQDAEFPRTAKFLGRYYHEDAVFTIYQFGAIVILGSFFLVMFRAWLSLFAFLGVYLLLVIHEAWFVYQVEKRYSDEE